MNGYNWFSVVIIYFLVQISVVTGRKLNKLNNTQKDLFPLTLIHINDFHARYEETNSDALDCKKEEIDECIGGYARIVTIVKELHRTGLNTIYMNAGDNYAGTIWFTFGGWNVTSYFLNLLRADVMTLGNHEFDLGPKKLVSFLDAIESPVVLANVDLSNEPQLKGKFKNSIVLNRGGQRIGIIGIISKDTYLESNTGKVTFLDDIETVHREANKLEADGINIIVVLSHCGIDADLQIARNNSKIDVIVGGHSHTTMYNGDAPGIDLPKYEYPVVVEQNSGHKVLIVQASAFAKYVGNLTVYFNELGEAIQWEGQPAYLGPHVEKDEQILKELIPWREQYQNKKDEQISVTNIILDNTNCWYDECVMGNVLTDAFMHSYRTITNNNGTAIAFAQGGGIRATIQKGPITFGDLVMVLPFNNRVDSFDLLGKYIWDAMEHSSTNIHKMNTNNKHMLQISGMQLVINATQAEGQRVVSIDILCRECTPPQYQPIDIDRMYRIVATNFLANGGNGYKMFEKHRQNYAAGELDIDAFVNYLQLIKLDTVDMGRINVLI